MKNEGAAIQVIAACSTGVMVSDLEIVVQMIGDDKMTLSPAGPVNVETAYVRCPQDAF